MRDRERLPVLLDMERVPATYPAPWSLEDPEPQEGLVPLSQYLWILKRHFWRISGFVAACAIAAVIVSARLTPIYESTATVDIDRQIPAGVVGAESQRGIGNDSDQFLATQIKLVQSDSVL